MESACYFGDSIGKGVIFDDRRNRYVTIKDSFVNLVSESWGVIKNFSRFGNTVITGLSRFENSQEEIASSEYVVFEFGGNDCDFNWTEISEQPNELHVPKTELQEFIAAYKSMVRKAIDAGKKVVVLNLPPVDHRKYFSWISKGRNADNIRFWLGGTSEFIYRWHERYNNAICEIANSLQVKLVDIRSIFLEKRNYSDYLCTDGIHPNEQGHRLMASAVIDVIRNSI